MSSGRIHKQKRVGVIGKHLQSCVEKLAEKCDEGKLTSKERSEYKAYVQASTVIGILRAKARKTLVRAKSI